MEEPKPHEVPPDGTTRCPGCGDKIQPGDIVIGVESENPWNELWHTACFDATSHC